MHLVCLGKQADLFNNGPFGEQPPTIYDHFSLNGWLVTQRRFYYIQNSLPGKVVSASLVTSTKIIWINLSLIKISHLIRELTYLESEAQA
jgi:hypothetical protein